MQDYYSILGLNKTASNIEIKAAFRRLAKIYHPDKNPNDPNAKTLFEQILKAYNTLNNHHTKKRYDDSISHHQTFQTTHKNTSQNKRNRGQKEWDATKEELERRAYFKKHYEQAKRKASAIQTNTNKKQYSDYKYVLFATPIAVGLLMLVVSLFNNEPISQNSKDTIKNIKLNNTNDYLSNGDKPYAGFFYNIQTFNTKHHLKINNSSNYDAVIVLYDKQTNTYLQHSYLQASYSVDFLMLPENGVYWKCVLGKNWNKDKLFFNNKISGGFDSIVQYQNWKTDPIEFKNENTEELTLLYVLNETTKNKPYISNEIDFFER